MGADLSTDKSKATKEGKKSSGVEPPRERSCSIDSNSTLTATDYGQSGLSRPIGAIGGSGILVGDLQQPSTGSKAGRRELPKEIIIVRRGDEGQEEERFTFPPPFKPLIPIGHESLLPSYPQLNSQIVCNLGLLLEEQLKSRSDFVATQQSVLCELVREIDFVTSFLTNSIFTERHKRLSKIADNFSKLDEIDRLVEKVEQDLKVAFARIDSLNSFLPQTARLEQFGSNTQVSRRQVV